MTLYEIDARLQALLEFDGEMIDTDSGEIVSLEDVEALQMAREEKVEGWGLWVKNQTAMIDALKSEEKKLKERREQLENRVRRSTERYQQYLDGEKVNTSRLSVSYRKSEQVELSVDPSQLPEQFQRVKTTVDADKTAIKAALKVGERIEGAQLITKQNMTIK